MEKHCSGERFSYSHKHNDKANLQQERVPSRTSRLSASLGCALSIGQVTEQEAASSKAQAWGAHSVLLPACPQ